MEGANGANPATEADLLLWPAPFDQPFYLVMNLAVGGKFLGKPDQSTIFPAETVIDYVRVYEKVGDTAGSSPAERASFRSANPWILESL